MNLYMNLQTSNPPLGHIDCPMCGNPVAVVHRAKGRRRRLYYRCYDEGGGMICGTLQPQGPAGQQFLEENTRFFKLDAKDAAADSAAAAAREETREAISTEHRQTERKRSRGLLHALLSEE